MEIEIDDNIILSIYKHCKIHPERLTILSETKINSPELFTKTLERGLLYLFVFTGLSTVSIDSAPCISVKNLFFENSGSTVEINDADFILYEINDIVSVEQKNMTSTNLLTSHIDVFDNLISMELCDEIRKYIDAYPFLHTEKWETKKNVNCAYLNLDDLDKSDPTKIRFDKEIFDVITRLIEELCKKYTITISGDSGYCLRKIYGPTRQHKDGININAVDNRYLPIRKIRNMSVIICLNDDYEGSEFYFPMQDYRIKLGKGQIITFPPYWTHPHLVYPPTNGTYRYTINTWLYE